MIIEKATQELKANWIKYSVTTISIIATILNIYKLPVCFAIWIFTNAFWMIIDFKKKIYAQSILFFIYFVLAIYGLINWLK